MTLSFIIRKLEVVAKITASISWIAAPMSWISPLEYPISHSTTPQLYIIPQKYDIMTDAVTLDTDFVGTLNTHITLL